MYATREQLRSLNGLGDDNVHTDADLDEAIVYAKAVIDRFTGTSFGNVETPAYDPFTVVLSGNGKTRITLVDLEGGRILFPRSISSVTIGGVPDAEVTYTLSPTGVVQRSSGAFSATTMGANVVISGTAGAYDSPPSDIAWAARSIARYWVLNLQSRMPDRAINLTTAEGAFEVRAQAGGPGRPTPMPDVNAVLNRHRHSFPIG